MGIRFDQYEMDVRIPTNLTYPEEFRVACKINNLKYEELLQYFIDHVSFYAFIGGEMELVHQWATKVTTDCKRAFNGVFTRINDIEIQRITLKYIKKLTGLSLNNTLSKESKILQSTFVVKAWSDEMQPLTNYETQLDSGDHHYLQLTFDFNLLCRVHGLTSVQLLQCFIDNISLARERAINLNEMIEPNPAMAILLLVVINNSEIKDKIMPHQQIYKQYGMQLLKLDKKQKKELSLQKRINSYSAFYLDWYNTLNNT